MALTRTFLAIELDEPTRAYIGARVNELTPAFPSVRFVAAATWHITLAFLGELTDAQLVVALAAARDAAVAAKPFTLHAGRVGTFGPDDAPRVIWLGVGGMTPALFALQRQIVTALNAHALPFHEHQYVPHITLAKPHRALTPTATQALNAFKTADGQGPALPVTAISVMKSELTPSGAHYTALDCSALSQPQ